MSDRQQDVLNAIDATLSGHVERGATFEHDDGFTTRSTDAMVWTPCDCTASAPCEQHDPCPPGTLMADLARANEAARELGRAIAEPFEAIARSINAAFRNPEADS